MCLEKRFYIPRTCVEAAYDRDDVSEHISGNNLLSDYRNRGAYVLLGDSGAGKTESFKYEAQQPGCKYIKAREFINFDVEESWKNKVLFIDGLDEVRAGTINSLVPLDKIRSKLKKLSCPSFRISCREADWLGAGDWQDLKTIAPCEEMLVLHLEPLDEEGIKEIVQHNAPSLNLEQFLEWAQTKDLISLFGNPAILNVFIKAIAADEWPDSRKQAYEMACNEIVQEYNREHLEAARRSKYPTEQVLDTAGMLYAHLLISGIEGFALSHNNENSQYPYFNKIFRNDSKLVEYTLKTKLFKPGDSSCMREPLHRSIAGYLAAEYLNRILENKGLPLGRILSLITSSDGGVVSSLRELYAWLTTTCITHREHMFSRDPLGIVLYGAVTTFTKQQKEILLRELYNEATQHTGFRSGNWIRSPFGALATPDMEDIFKEIIESSSRDDANQALVDCVMDALEYGAAYSNLEKPLWNIVKDHTWWSGIRDSALQILLKDYADESSNYRGYLILLEDIQNGVVEDRNDNLLGMLLLHLYPEVLPAQKVISYLHKPKNARYYGAYNRFWEDNLIERSSRDDIAELLDELSGKKEINDLFRHNSLHDFLSDLLAKGLVQWGDSIDISRLYNWLGVLLDKHGVSSVNQDKQQVTVKQWISERPERYKAVLMEGVRRLPNDKSNSFYLVYGRLFGAEEPVDIGCWYLEQAALHENNEIANNFFHQAVSLLQSGEIQAKFMLDDILGWVNNHPRFKDELAGRLVVKGKNYDRLIDNAYRREKRNKGENQKKLHWMAELTKYKEEIKNGTAPPAIFHDIAFAYYGHLIEARGDTPYERLKSIFHGRQDMYEISLEGLKNVIYRNDFPSIQDIIKTHISGRRFFIGQAVLACLDEIYTNSPDDLNHLTEQQYEYALAFYFTESSGNKSAWIELILKNHPVLVSEVFIKYAISCLKAGKDHISGVYQLACDELWSQVANVSVIKLLEKFPVRAKSLQIHNLDYLLKAALKNVNYELLPLVDTKLQSKSMDVMQRSRWLATGLLLNSKKYEDKVYEFMGGNSKRIHAVAGVLTSRHDQWRPDYNLPETTIGMLIQKLGGLFKPYRINGASRVTPAMDAADLVSNLINKLSANESIEANIELERLVGLPELTNWKDNLRGALYHQRKVMRDATFKIPDILQVRKTLENAEPANAADLMAITQYHLGDLSTRVRNDSTDDYKQYWNTDKNNRPIKPKVENACRDAFLSDLKKLLAPLNIDASKEGHYADEKRADIKLSFNGVNGFNVPVEIKCNSNRELWSAFREQLIQKYTRDPGAQGYGVYLVFWFGENFTAPPPHGKKPKSALELKEMLSGMMSDEERRMIGLCVIDCSIH